MDATRFDSLCRTLTTAASRRLITRALAGLLLGGPLGALRDPLATGAKKGGKKGKGKKGKRKKKGCSEGQRLCGTTCIPASTCCPSEVSGEEECDPCARETCVNGTCQCFPGLIKHNGVCGFFINCKSLAERCFSHDECCSDECLELGKDPTDGSGRCGPSTGHCLAHSDCLPLFGPCRGFMCPDLYRANTGLSSC